MLSFGRMYIRKHAVSVVQKPVQVNTSIVRNNRFAKPSQQREHPHHTQDTIYTYTHRSICVPGELVEKRVVPLPVNQHIRVLSVDAHQDGRLLLGPLELEQQVGDATACPS